MASPVKQADPAAVLAEALCMTSKPVGLPPLLPEHEGACTQRVLWRVLGSLLRCWTPHHVSACLPMAAAGLLCPTCCGCCAVVVDGGCDTYAKLTCPRFAAMAKFHPLITSLKKACGYDRTWAPAVHQLLSHVLSTVLRHTRPNQKLFCPCCTSQKNRELFGHYYNTDTLVCKRTCWPSTCAMWLSLMCTRRRLFDEVP